MAKKPKNFPTSMIGVMMKDGEYEGKLMRKRCWQCRCRSIITNGKWQMCLNQCGPEALGKMFSF